MSESRWIVSGIPSVEDIGELSEKLGISRLLAAILCIRGKKDEAENLITNNTSSFHDPFLLNDMNRAVARIETALLHSEKITVYGDYDADGVTATAIVTDFLMSLGANVDFYIPSRENEGYGIHAVALENIAQNGTSLIITVDCGITAIDECKLAKKLGIDIVITDHHNCMDVLPDAAAVVNPKRDDCDYPFQFLAGAGVALKLVMAVAQKRGLVKNVFDTYCAMASIGTIADIMPIKDENRLLVINGLESIKSCKNPGLKSMMDILKLDANKISASDIGFFIAPVLNAAGRLEEAKDAVVLLICSDKDKTRKIAEKFYGYNKERQRIEQSIVYDAVKRIERDSLLCNKVIVLEEESWHQGVIGIVASRIVKQFHRPCILLTRTAEGNWKGSGRSIDKFSLYNALDFCSDLLIKFGGHDMAAGVELSSENLDAFNRKINTYADGFLKKEDMVKTLYIDCELRGRHLNLFTARELKRLEPFGMDNAPPVFIIKRCSVINIATMGAEKKHIRLTLLKDNMFVNAVAFNMAERFLKCNKGDWIDVVCSLDMNGYNGQESVQLLVKDFE